VAGDGEQRSRKEFLERCLAVLTQEKPARTLQIPKNSPEERFMKEYGLLTAKEELYIGNVDENQIQAHFANSLQDPKIKALEKHAQDTGAEVVLVSAKIEAELFELKKEEKAELLSSLGMKEAALASKQRVAHTSRDPLNHSVFFLPFSFFSACFLVSCCLAAVARKAYGILGLQSFYTAGEQEVRAWKIMKGTAAAQAVRTPLFKTRESLTDLVCFLFSLQAGTIHSDIEKGFIRAETYSVGDLVEHGTVEKIKAAGKMRSEGRDYVMKPEDVVNFLFNVSKSKK